MTMDLASGIRKATRDEGATARSAAAVPVSCCRRRAYNRAACGRRSCGGRWSGTWTSPRAPLSSAPALAPILVCVAPVSPLNFVVGALIPVTVPICWRSGCWRRRRGWARRGRRRRGRRWSWGGRRGGKRSGGGSCGRRWSGTWTTPRAPLSSAPALAPILVCVAPVSPLNFVVGALIPVTVPICRG